MDSSNNNKNSSKLQKLQKIAENFRKFQKITKNYQKSHKLQSFCRNITMLFTSRLLLKMFRLVMIIP